MTQTDRESAPTPSSVVITIPSPWPPGKILFAMIPATRPSTIPPIIPICTLGCGSATCVSAGELRRLSATNAPTANARPLSAPAPISNRRLSAASADARPACSACIQILFRAAGATSAPSSAFRFVNTFMSAGIPATHETEPGVMATVVD